MSQILLILCSFFLAFSLTGCVEQNQQQESQPKQQPIKSSVKAESIETKPSEVEKNPQENKGVPNSSNPTPSQISKKPAQPKPASLAQKDAIQVVANPASIPVLVNKQNKLPDSYNPSDLVYTSIPFIFSGKSDKRKMRKEAETAIANLFAGAKQQGINLLGVSAYRSHATQTNLFNAYVKKDGYEKARTYSALPGTSEHETGLSIDVTGGNGKCAAQDCFGNTSEAKWLQNHVSEYGFIIRYPKGKESITGYKYEPWHLRYVGNSIAKEIMSAGSTMEEYYNTIPVNK
jgi:zinc D-Ala-D-Ala carboxypeptidase